MLGGGHLVIERLLEPVSTELPVCRCGVEMKSMAKAGQPRRTKQKFAPLDARYADTRWDLLFGADTTANCDTSDA